MIVNVRDQIISEQHQSLREVEGLKENVDPDPNDVPEERRMPEQVHDQRDLEEMVEDREGIEQLSEKQNNEVGQGMLLLKQPPEGTNEEMKPASSNFSEKMNQHLAPQIMMLDEKQSMKSLITNDNE